MDIRKSLTILLSLKDRAPLTFRWMRYAECIHLPFQVLIADGGKDERVPELLASHKNFPNVNYEYARYPFDQSYLEYYSKMADALSRIDTPFVAMVDNDEFLTVEGLERGAEFLQYHPDYSSCRGAMMRVSVTEEAVRFRKYQAQIHSITDENATRRVQSHFSSYGPTFYDVHRTQQLRVFFQALRELNPRDIYLAELITSFLAVAAGKVRREPDYLFAVRQDTPGESSAEAHRQRWGDLFDRMFLESWSSDFAKFVNVIAGAIAGKDGISLEAAQNQVKQGYRVYAAPHLIDCLSSARIASSQSTLAPLGWVRRLEYNSKVRRALRNVRAVMRGQLTKQPALSIAKSPGELRDLGLIYDFLTTELPT